MSSCKPVSLCIVFLFIGVLLSQPSYSQPNRREAIPARGMPTVLDLGATACVPCKMMAPILEKLKIEYQGRAAVIFVDVWKDATEAERFGIRTIPTQIFFDKNGDEIWRHEGFLDEKSIVNILDALLSDQKPFETPQVKSSQLIQEGAAENVGREGEQVQTFLVILSILILLILTGGIIYKIRKKHRGSSFHAQSDDAL